MRFATGRTVGRPEHRAAPPLRSRVVTAARRRSLVVGGLLGLAVALLALVGLRSLGGSSQVEVIPPGPPGPSPEPGIPTQADLTGATLPDTDLERLEGGRLRFGALEGRPLVVNFWAEWCEPCTREMPELESAHATLGTRVGFVGVNLRDGLATARAVAARTGVTYPLVRDPDGAVATDLEIVRMPTTLFVDPEGTVVGYHAGELSRDEIRAAIERYFPA